MSKRVQPSDFEPSDRGQKRLLVRQTQGDHKESTFYCEPFLRKCFTQREIDQSGLDMKGLAEYTNRATCETKCQLPRDVDNLILSTIGDLSLYDTKRFEGNKDSAEYQANKRVYDAAQRVLSDPSFLLDDPNNGALGIITKEWQQNRGWWYMWDAVQAIWYAWEYVTTPEQEAKLTASINSCLELAVKHTPNVLPWMKAFLQFLGKEYSKFSRILPHMYWYPHQQEWFIRHFRKSYPELDRMPRNTFRAEIMTYFFSAEYLRSFKQTIRSLTFGTLHLWPFSSGAETRRQIQYIFGFLPVSILTQIVSLAWKNKDIPFPFGLAPKFLSHAKIHDVYSTKSSVEYSQLLIRIAEEWFQEKGGKNWRYRKNTFINNVESEFDRFKDKLKNGEIVSFAESVHQQRESSLLALSELVLERHETDNADTDTDEEENDEDDEDDEDNDDEGEDDDEQENDDDAVNPVKHPPPPPPPLPTARPFGKQAGMTTVVLRKF